MEEPTGSSSASLVASSSSSSSAQPVESSTRDQKKTIRKVCARLLRQDEIMTVDTLVERAADNLGLPLTMVRKVIVKSTKKFRIENGIVKRKEKRKKKEERDDEEGGKPMRATRKEETRGSSVAGDANRVDSDSERSEQAPTTGAKPDDDGPSKSDNPPSDLGSAVKSTKKRKKTEEKRSPKKKKKRTASTDVSIHPSLPEKGTLDTTTTSTTTTTTQQSFTCPHCGRNGFLSQSTVNSHQMDCQKRIGETSNVHFSLTPPHLRSDVLLLSDFCQIIVRSIDLYQVHATDLPMPTRGRHKIVQGAIGVRCIYCAQQRKLRVGSILFPGSLDLLPILVYRMASAHLLSTCPHIPGVTKTQLEQTKATTVSQSMTKGRLGLPTYLKTIATFYQLVNDDDNATSKGICRRQVPLLPSVDTLVEV